MVSTKRLVQMARMWHKMAVLGRRRIMMSTRADGGEYQHHAVVLLHHAVAKKGHVFGYTVDGCRFMIPLPYLSSNIFRELFRLSEEEFGLTIDGPIKLPCDGTSMDYILITLLRRPIATGLETAVLTSVWQCPAPLPLCERNQLQQIICSF